MEDKRFIGMICDPLWDFVNASNKLIMDENPSVITKSDDEEEINDNNLDKGDL